MNAQSLAVRLFFVFIFYARNRGGFCVWRYRMRLRILSWNVWDENKKSAEYIAQFIRAQNADVACLQEVATHLWKELRPLLSGVYECHTAHDMRSEGKEPCMLMFLSRIPVIQSAAIRTRSKRGWRSWFSSWKQIEEHLEFQRIDVETKDGRMRIMNVHLEVGTSPCNRLNQFKYVLRRCKRRGVIKHAVVVGDLNIFGDGWYPSFVGWLWHGFKSKWLWLNEREEFTKICKKRGLKNIFEGQPTFSIAGSEFQLDHILVPEKAAVFSHEVIEDTCGSDHKAIVADITI